MMPPEEVYAEPRAPEAHKDEAEQMAHAAFSAAKRLKDWLKSHPGDHSHIYLSVVDADGELFDCRNLIRSQRDDLLRSSQRKRNLENPSFSR